MRYEPIRGESSRPAEEGPSADRSPQRALQERVKELTCLYGVARLAERSELPLDELLRGIAALLPPAWQFPEAARARIVLDDAEYATPGFAPGLDRLRAPLVVGGRDRGLLEVVYLDRRPPADEGPFLAEERHLLDGVAREVAAILDRRDAQAERSRLERELLRADRLATVGQLAAGVAHELNEPLAAILGFAQLAQAAPNVPESIAADLGKIVQACLHAREVVRKLRLFARQLPEERHFVSLNDIIRDNTYLFAARCGREGIELVQELAPDLPAVVGNPAQLAQVLLNLVVNALQAMTPGGRLTLRTQNLGDRVALVVEDTGEGMSEDVLDQIFVPFFTTKDVDRGVGLGLAVVHGIVSAHGGTIVAESRPGAGSRFTVRFPAAGRGPGPAETEESE
jgi:two-component system NtrC family sensor kinase